MSVEYSRRAITDLKEISDYYLSRAGNEVARRFEARLKAVLDRVAKRPETAPAVIQRPGVRVALVSGFPYKVFYRPLDEGRIRVLHIRHMARRPVA
jgi:plasmid stabilization system protein ParE